MIKQVSDLSRKMIDYEVLDAMSPNSRDVYTTAIGNERKTLLNKM